MKLNYFAEFKDNGAIQSLKDVSMNTAAGINMTDNGKLVVNFDRAKTNYCNRLNKSEEYAASADALCRTSDKDSFYLIEFKDGDIDNKQIRDKAIDSVYIFSGITGEDVNYVRENIAFVLVYNSSVRKLNSREKLSIARANRGRGDFAIFGLEKLKGFYYNKIQVIDKNEFSKSDILKKIISV